MSIPKLPQEMGHAGENVWAWASALSEAVHRAHEIRELNEKLYNMRNKCGSCSKWMTNSCPREKHDNQKGHKIGPSSGALKCGEFQMQRSYEAMIEQAEAKLESLLGRGGK